MKSASLFSYNLQNSKLLCVFYDSDKGAPLKTRFLFLICLVLLCFVMICFFFSLLFFGFALFCFSLLNNIKQ